MRIFMYVHPEIDNKKVQSIVLGARPKGKKKDKKNLLTQDSTRWEVLGCQQAYSSWRVGCNGASADKSPLTAFTCTCLFLTLPMSKLCKDVRLPMAMGTGPCNPVFDRFLHHTTPSIYLNIFTWISMNWNSHENSRRYQSLECYTYKVMSRISEREKDRESWISWTWFVIIKSESREKKNSFLRERERESCLQSNNRDGIQVTGHQGPVSSTRISSWHPWDWHITIPLSDHLQQEITCNTHDGHQESHGHCSNYTESIDPRKETILLARKKIPCRKFQLVSHTHVWWLHTPPT